MLLVHLLASLPKERSREGACVHWFSAGTETFSIPFTYRDNGTKKRKRQEVLSTADPEKLAPTAVCTVINPLVG